MIKKKGGSGSLESVDSPVFPSMSSTMKVDFLYNQDGKAWLLHDRPLPDILKWVEYDSDTENVTLVTRSGKIQDLGLKVPAGQAMYIERAMEITVLLMNGGKIADFAIVPMITRNITVN